VTLTSAACASDPPDAAVASGCSSAAARTYSVSHEGKIRI